MSHEAIRNPDPNITLTVEQLGRLQRAAATHFTFHVTMACPLRCAHCIVDAGPDRKDTTISKELAGTYAAQFPALYADGLRAISFTGGEALIAAEPVRILSEAAADAGIVCGIVTSGYWAVSGSSARRTLEKFSAVRVWDFSVDCYHQDFVPIEHVRRGFEMAREMGRTAALRFTHHDPLTEGDRSILDYLGQFADQSEVASQRVRLVGRAGKLPPPAEHDYNLWAKPCFTQGPGVRPDGSIALCCVNMVEERNHPFELGNARERPLTEIRADYLSLPLLQMFRLIGFAEPVQWVEETGMAGELPARLPDDVCDLCPMLLTNPRLGSYLATRAAEPMNRLRLGILASSAFGEHWLLKRAVQDLKPIAREIEGFEIAEALAAGAGSPGRAA